MTDLTATPDAAPPLPAGLPSDWTFPHELACPTCGYNLHMLRTPRCPECGGGFRWQTLLRIRCPRCDESLEAHDGDECPKCRLALDWRRILDEARPEELTLYEYSRTPVRAGLKAWREALRPARFWNTIPLELPPVVGRLRGLRAVAFLVAFIGAAAAFFREPSREVLDLMVVAFAIPITTMLLLPGFHPTLGRFRVRRDQLLRVFAYASGSLFWGGILLLLLAGVLVLDSYLYARAMRASLAVPNRLSILPARTMLEPTAWFVFPIAILWTGVVWPIAFYAVALRRYLRLDRPNVWALMLSTQVIAILLMLILLVRRLTRLLYF